MQKMVALLKISQQLNFWGIRLMPHSLHLRLTAKSALTILFLVRLFFAPLGSVDNTHRSFI